MLEVWPVAFCQKVVAEGVFTNSDEMGDYLDNKFKYKSDLTFYFKKIDCLALDEEQASAELKDTETVDGSSSFHAIVFKPGESILWGATVK